MDQVAAYFRREVAEVLDAANFRREVAVVLDAANHEVVDDDADDDDDDMPALTGPYRFDEPWDSVAETAPHTLPRRVEEETSELMRGID